MVNFNYRVIMITTDYILVTHLRGGTFFAKVSAPEDYHIGAFVDERILRPISEFPPDARNSIVNLMSKGGGKNGT